MSKIIRKIRRGFVRTFGCVKVFSSSVPNRYRKVVFRRKIVEKNKYGFLIRLKVSRRSTSSGVAIPRAIIDIIIGKYFPISERSNE